MNQVTSTNQIIGTMEGHRGIRFDFVLTDGTRRHVTFDFYGNATNLNGATYARFESAALRAITNAGLTAEGWKAFTFA